jgi:tetratricopeptide (TPR) repeat protein
MDLPAGGLATEAGPRYRLLETVRDYALEQLEASGEAEQMGRAHAEFFLAMVASVPGGQVTEQKQKLFARMDRDFDNVRTALSWTLDQEQPDMAARFGMQLTAYWVLRGYYREGLDWLSRILELHTRVGAGDPAALGTRSYLLYYASTFNTYLVNYSAARACIEKAIALQGEMGADPLASAPYIFKAVIALQQQEYAEAETLAREYLGRVEASGNRMGEINALWLLGAMSSEQGDQQTAINLLARSLAVAREIGDVYVAMGALRDLAMAFAYAGEYDRAAELYDEYFRLVEHDSVQVGVSWGLIGQAFTAMRQGNPTRARALYLNSLTLSKTMEKQRTPECLEGLAEIELAGPIEASPDGARRAATLLGAAAAIRRMFGVPIIPARASMRDQLVTEARTRLGEAEYSRAYGLGEAMSLEEVTAWVLDSSKAPAEH